MTDKESSVPSSDLLAKLRNIVDYKCTIMAAAASCDNHPLRWYMSHDAAKHAYTHMSGILQDIDDSLANTKGESHE